MILTLLLKLDLGKTLSGFVKRTPADKPIKIFSVNNISSLKETIKSLKEEESEK